MPKNSREQEEDWLRARRQGDIAAEASQEGCLAFVLSTVLILFTFEMLNCVAVDKLNIEVQNIKNLFIFASILELPASVALGYLIGSEHQQARSK